MHACMDHFCTARELNSPARRQVMQIHSHMNGQQHFSLRKEVSIPAMKICMSKHMPMRLLTKGLCVHKRGCYSSPQKPAGLSKVNNYIVDVLAPHFLGRLTGGSSAAIWLATFLTLEI